MFQEILNDGISGSTLLLEKTLKWMEFLLVSGEAVPAGALDSFLEVHSGMACFHHVRRFF